MSESSLDSELLAGRAKGGKKRGRKALSDSDYEESDESVSLDDESEEWEEEKPSKKRGSAQKPARKKRATRGRKAASSEDEEEEDEEEEDSGDSGGGGGAPASGGRGGGGGGRRRAAKDESSDDDGFEIDDEALIEGEEDRKRLAAMTELQREFELANRAEKRNAELLRQKLLKQDAKAAEAGAKAAKRVGRSKSGREEREEAAKKSAMEELKAARERKARGAEERARKREEESEEELSEEEEKERRRERSPEEGLISDDELDSDLVRERERRLYGRAEEGEDEEDEAPLDDIRRMQVRRSRLEEWLNEPFFEDTLPGCLVKVPAPGGGEVLGPDGRPVIGPDGRPLKHYLLCQVITVETRPAGVYKDAGYPLQSPYRIVQGGPKTAKWLLVERGASQRFMPMLQVSNQPLDEREFESLQRALREARRPQISRRTARDVHERLVKAVNYTYTAADVDRLLKEKRAKGAAPRNAALEKARLENELSHAREHGEAERVAELEATLAGLEAAPAGGAGRRSKFDMASLNKRNADANFKNALDNVSNRPGAAQGGAAAGGTAESSRLDPFSRRATRPQIYWSTKRQADGEGGDARQEPAAAAAPAEGANGAAEDGEAAAGAGRRKGGRLDLDAIVDLSTLDLSALERPARMPPLARKLLGPTWRPNPPPPGLPVVSLDEYKRSKGWA